jgi:hypothetical protein
MLQRYNFFLNMQNMPALKTTIKKHAQHRRYYYNISVIAVKTIVNIVINYKNGCKGIIWASRIVPSGLP